MRDFWEIIEDRDY